MHSIGLAVDFMTRSNMDVYRPGYRGKAGRPIGKYCQAIKKELKKPNSTVKALMTNYSHLRDLESNVTKCISQPTKAIPWSTIPKKFVQIFQTNGFHWGGDGWSIPGRSDSMHFEYHGPCKKQ